MGKTGFPLLSLARKTQPPLSYHHPNFYLRVFRGNWEKTGKIEKNEKSTRSAGGLSGIIVL
jgi:hypothetical protein